MREGFPTIEKFESFRPEDAEKLSEITRIREELLKSEDKTVEDWRKKGWTEERIAEELKYLKEYLNPQRLKKTAQEVFGALETHEQERETIDVDEEKKEIRIGRETTPIFEGPKEKLGWQLQAEQFREEGQTMVELSFKRNDGVEVKPGGVARGKTRFGEHERYLPLEEYKSLKKENSKYLAAMEKMSGGNEEERKAAEEYLTKFKQDHPNSEWVLRAMRHLNSLAVTPQTEKILEKDPTYQPIQYHVQKMEELTQLLNIQRASKRGMVVIEGPAGTGKNKIIDHIAALTQRPIFPFSCTRGKDEQDIKYLLELHTDERGSKTVRLNSKVIQALETPGAILLLDEVNRLREDAADILLPILDYNRTMRLEEKDIKAAPEVLIVGTKNPKRYFKTSGHGEMPRAIEDRSVIMEIEYPPFEKEKANSHEPTQYRSDEAMIVRQYIPELKDLDQREFQMLWDSVVNKREDPRATELLTVARKERIEDIFTMISIADAIRKAADATFSNKASIEDELHFDFSIRQWDNIIPLIEKTELTPEENKKGITRAKKALWRVIRPKIAENERDGVYKFILEH